ncbi:MAG: hypothetical protein WA855_03740, partial [Candidatus Acidiferrales bacterium]
QMMMHEELASQAERSSSGRQWLLKRFCSYTDAIRRPIQAGSLENPDVKSWLVGLSETTPPIQPESPPAAPLFRPRKRLSVIL